MEYALVKFLHVLVAIVALGTSAGLGVLLEFYGDDAAHRAFLLRAIQRVETYLVLPGYVLMLLTGLWLASLAWPFTTPWIQAALLLWAVGMLLLGAYLPILRRQVRALGRDGAAGARSARLARAGRVVGAAAGLVIVLIVYLMVVKPPLAWWPAR